MQGMAYAETKTLAKNRDDYRVESNRETYDCKTISVNKNNDWRN